MGKRPAAAKATRGVSKVKAKVQSSSSNPKTTKFRSQYNKLSVIAKGGPSKKSENNKKGANKKNGQASKIKGKQILDALESVDLMEHDGNRLKGGDGTSAGSIKTGTPMDAKSETSVGTKRTNASFASVWSNCTNASLNEFFQSWNPKLDTHKDALAVIAGLSQIMNNTNTEQTNLEYAKTLFTIMASPETPRDVLTGALLALTFVIRKLPAEAINENFDTFYPTLKNLMETYHNSKKKTLIKSLLRCFACLTKAHPLGKEAIESGPRKLINIAIRQHKVQDKIRL